jgi:23S rRNA pseudouridine955/2504/2580 synthase
MDMEKKEVVHSVRMVEVTGEDEGQRLDNFLSRYLKGLPKGRMYKIIRKGEVRVNSKRCEISTRLLAGDLVRIPPVTVDETQVDALPQGRLNQLKDAIIYEDDVMLVLNKPTGVAVHGGSGLSFGAIEGLRQLYANQPAVQLELVHRLDRDTSGVLVIAKKRSALRALHALMRDGKTHKHYLALVQGVWPKHLQKVDVPLTKNEQQSGERMVKVDPEGKESLTRYRTEQSFGELASLMAVKIETGRTHQIRVHSLYAGHPLAGDDKYGDREFNRQMKHYGLKRLFLHAHQMKFEHPVSGEFMEITAPLTEDLEKVLEALRKEWA